MLQKIDSLILRTCTHFAHWFQRLTGKTNFFLARVMAAGILVSGTILVLGVFLPLLRDVFPSEVVILMFFVAIFGAWHLKWYSQLHEIQWQQAQDNGCMPLYAAIGQELWFLRLINFIFALSLTLISANAQPSWHILKPVFRFQILPEMIYHTWPMFMIIGGYFSEVIPLPPGKSRARRWLESAKERFRTQPASLPVPSNAS